MKFFGKLQNAWNSVKSFGHRVNAGFNNVKGFVRKHSGTIRNVASAVGDVARHWSDLPYVGSAASAVGQVARGVHTGVNLANRGIDALEGGQRHLGLPIR
jgi:hypothetical protein